MARGYKRQKSSSKRTDYISREAKNSKLGRQGERFVIEFEKKRLYQTGQANLISKIEWTSKKYGDKEGYDILSYDESNNPIHIEVKTTNQGQLYPFIISANEVKASKTFLSSYRIYRVFNFSKQPQIFVIKGPIKKACHLRPLTFEASF